MMVGAGREVAGKEERAVDITDISDKQTEIDNDIKNKWGNGSPTLLSGTITKDNINANTGDYWYYLNSDIIASFSDTLNIKGNVRIVLNGYAISGTFKIRAYDSNATISIFDKIPGKSGTGYTYNSSPVKYYKYNSGIGRYTDYLATAPSSTNVTDMPTFKADTYIKVTGSAFSPNALTTASNTSIAAWPGTVNIYAINIVGGNFTNRILDIDGTGKLNMYQSTLIGNSARLYGALSCSAGTAVLEGCKIYGNQGNNTTYGIELLDSNISGSMYDISLYSNTNRARLEMYKCNVGAVLYSGSSISHYSVYLKDVNFGNTAVTVTDGTAATFFESLNNISGTIELVYNNTTNYTGNSPNLNFIVHGNDSNSAPRKGKNTLTVSGTCGNISTVFDDTKVVNPITVNGTCSGISTRGNVTIGSSGKVTVKNGQTVGGVLSGSGVLIIEEGGSCTINSSATFSGTVTNNGTLTLAGTVTNLTNNGNLVIPQGKSYTISSGQTLGGNVTNQGTLTVASGVTVTNLIDNAGTLNVTGTVSDVYGYGGINVNANGNVTIPEGKNQF